MTDSAQSADIQGTPGDAGTDGGVPTETTKISVVRSVGDYKLIRVLGSGASGTVFLAEHIFTGQKYAIKMLRVNIPKKNKDMNKLVKRFVNENAAVSRLNHPGIVKFYEFGFIGRKPERHPYIVMEYFEGDSLDRYIKDRGLLSIPQKILILEQLAMALDAVHSKDIMHRDIKPENILVDSRLNVKITDFGICRLPAGESMEATMSIAGTPSYMPPEYISSGETDNRGDIFALGVTAYELFTGLRPFQARGVREIFYKTLNEFPPEPRKVIPGFPQEIQSVLAGMLKKNPAHRYKTARKLLKDIKRLGRPPEPEGMLSMIFRAISGGGRDWS